MADKGSAGSDLAWGDIAIVLILLSSVLDFSAGQKSYHRVEIFQDSAKTGFNNKETLTKFVNNVHHPLIYSTHSPQVQQQHQHQQQPRQEPSKSASYNNAIYQQQYSGQGYVPHQQQYNLNPDQQPQHYDFNNNRQQRYDFNNPHPQQQGFQTQHPQQEQYYNNNAGTHRPSHYSNVPQNQPQQRQQRQFIDHQEQGQAFIDNFEPPPQQGFSQGFDPGQQQFFGPSGPPPPQFDPFQGPSGSPPLPFQGPSGPPPHHDSQSNPISFSEPIIQTGENPKGQGSGHFGLPPHGSQELTPDGHLLVTVEAPSVVRNLRQGSVYPDTPSAYGSPPSSNYGGPSGQSGYSGGQGGGSGGDSYSGGQSSGGYSSSSGSGGQSDPSSGYGPPSGDSYRATFEVGYGPDDGSYGSPSYVLKPEGQTIYLDHHGDHHEGSHHSHHHSSHEDYDFFHNSGIPHDISILHGHSHQYHHSHHGHLIPDHFSFDHGHHSKPVQLNIYPKIHIYQDKGAFKPSPVDDRGFQASYGPPSKGGSGYNMNSGNNPAYGPPKDGGGDYNQGGGQVTSQGPGQQQQQQGPGQVNNGQQGGFTTQSTFTNDGGVRTTSRTVTSISGQQDRGIVSNQGQSRGPGQEIRGPVVTGQGQQGQGPQQAAKGGYDYTPAGAKPVAASEAPQKLPQASEQVSKQELSNLLAQGKPIQSLGSVILDSYEVSDVGDGKFAFIGKKKGAGAGGSGLLDLPGSKVKGPDGQTVFLVSRLLVLEKNKTQNNMNNNNMGRFRQQGSNPQGVVRGPPQMARRNGQQQRPLNNNNRPGNNNNINNHIIQQLRALNNKIERIEGRINKGVAKRQVKMNVKNIQQSVNNANNISKAASIEQMHKAKS